MTVVKHAALRSQTARLSVAAATSIALVVGAAAPAHAVPEQSTGVETNHPATALIGQKVSFDYASAKEGLEELRRLRAEMWDKNPTIKMRILVDNYPEDVRGTVQELAANADLKSKEDYVNAAVLDGGYVQMAVQLSAEQPKPGTQGTTRPFNSKCELAGPGAGASQCQGTSTATVGGVASDGAIISTSTYSEIASGLIATGIKDNTVVSHNLAQLLNPYNTRFGFASVKVNYGTNDTDTISAITYGTEKTTVDYSTFKPGQRDTTIYRAARSFQLGSGPKDEAATGYTTPAFDPTASPVTGTGNTGNTDNTGDTGGTSPGTGNTGGSGDGEKLTPGAIAGIIVAVLAVLGIGGWVAQNWPMIAKMLRL
ncbi:hypothetical protein [Corynebacterium aquatimens]|uniref:Secreted protein n=1 Tax=Corynebacterium aquatimens TaxID=1190508 RepID=A0A931GU26_9CORY|nr:hypothetical protein [Corynebacterium aquatimens]MBG6122355.1 hypothetical protein [Corynebacterium aquatimens]WJY65102.1 hypothetical protein CAQUA_01845 [Corynebacterium aquatimens]